MKQERNFAALACRAAEELFAKDRSAGAAFSRATLSESEHQKARLFAFTRAYGAARTSAFEHRERLKEAAGLIPGFSAFRHWCLEDIKAAWLEDRERKTRQAKSRRLTWLHLFKPFARLHRIGQALEICALDRQGNYLCELVERAAPKRNWGQLVRLAREFGIQESDLLALADEAGRKRGEGQKRETAQA